MLTPDKIYTGKSLWSAYNLTGNLFTNPAYPGIETALSLDRFLTEMDRKAVELGIPAINAAAGGAAAGGAAAGGNHGGRRRTRHKKRKINRRRR